MDGCFYRTKDGECDLYSEGGTFKAFCDPEHCDNIAPTNADRIRAMTDEELAEFITPVKCVDCHLLDCGIGEIGNNKSCTERIIDWLKEEASK